MRRYDDITPALQAILRSCSTGDTACWVSFFVDVEKVDGIDRKWREVYGTTLPAEARRRRKKNGLPTAWAACLPVLGNEYKRQLILLASGEVSKMGATTPWAREGWISRPPEASDFVMVKEPRERGDYAWTWRIQNRPLGLVEQHLAALVKSGDASAVAQYSHWLPRFYPLFGGVRRQLRRMLHGARKLWLATCKTNWPGPDPDHLPMMIGFRKEIPKPVSDSEHSKGIPNSVAESETECAPEAESSSRAKPGQQ